MAIEILGGDGIEFAFEKLGIDAKKTYETPTDPYAEWVHYEVYEISKQDLRKLEYMEEWCDDWGWWRYAKGSNMGTACDFFTVNGKELIAWEGLRRDGLRDDWDEEPDEEKAAYHYSFKEYEADVMPHTYDNLLEYMCDELGASTEKNVCALAVDLAKANGMSMAKLFQTYYYN